MPLSEEGPVWDLEGVCALATPGVDGLNGRSRGSWFEPHMDGPEFSMLEMEAFSFQIFFGNDDATVPVVGLAVLDR